MRELYIYWRCRPGHEGEAGAAVRAFQRHVRERWPELEARLLRRAEGARSTWMEVYTRPGGIDDALERALRAEGDAQIAPWVDGARQVEVFEPVDPTRAR